MKSKKPKEIDERVITAKDEIIIYVSDKFENINKSEEKQWLEIQKELKKINSTKDKLILLHIKLAEYYQNLPVQTLNASGIITNEYKNLGKLFLDKKITTEIELLKELMNIEEKERFSKFEFVSDEEVIPTEIQQKICWLYAIGIIDYIKDKNKLNIQSPTTIGKILALGTGIKWDTIKKTIERIENDNLLDRYSSYINAECLRLKITRLK
jgi:hypothetical protein